MSFPHSVDDEHWRLICAVNNAPCKSAQTREAIVLQAWRKGVEAAAKSVYGDTYECGLALRGDELYFERKSKDVAWLCGGLEWSRFDTPLEEL